MSSDKEKLLTQDDLKRQILYLPESGQFIWKTSGGRRRPGEAAGRVNKRGYWEIGLCGQRFLSHRIAWLYMTGKWPAHQIDHANRDSLDNRWSNLREATHQENMRNTRANGFTWNKRQKVWIAQIKVDYKNIILGRFDNIIDARAQYLRERSRIFGEFS